MATILRMPCQAAERFLYIKHEFVAVSCKKAGSCSLKSCVLDKMADIRLRATEDLVYVKKSVHLDANR